MVPSTSAYITLIGAPWSIWRIASGVSCWEESAGASCASNPAGGRSLGRLYGRDKSLLTLDMVVSFWARVRVNANRKLGIEQQEQLLLELVNSVDQRFGAGAQRLGRGLEGAFI